MHFPYKNGSHPLIKHPGIYLGYDVHGSQYYMHNHNKTGRPAIVVKAEFDHGQTVYLYDGIAINSPSQIIENGLKQVLTGEPYKLLNYNCQSFVNRARQNTNRSEAVENWIGGIGLGVLFFLGLKALNNSK